MVCLGLNKTAFLFSCIFVSGCIYEFQSFKPALQNFGDRYLCIHGKLTYSEMLVPGEKYLPGGGEEKVEI